MLCIAMTCVLRFIDVRYLLPKRLAFAAGLESGEVIVAGHSVAKDSIEGQVIVDEDGDVKKATTEVTVKDATSKDASAA